MFFKNHTTNLLKNCLSVVILYKSGYLYYNYNKENYFCAYKLFFKNS